MLSFSVEVDLAEVEAVTRAAVKSLERAPAAMNAVLVRKAREARRTHRYQNRTFRLQSSTFTMGPVTFGHDAYGSEFGARAPYAGYVEDRGFQRVGEMANEAQAEIAALFEHRILGL